MKPYYDHGGITIYHGDNDDPFQSLASLGSAWTDAVITDPPYLNTGIGTSRASRVAAIPDERQFFDFWMRALWGHLARALKPTGGLWMTIDWRGAVSCERAATGSPLEFGATGVWAKDGLGMGFMLRRTYECFVVARMPEWERRLADEPDVWRVKWTPSDRRWEHEAEKPIALIARATRLLGVQAGGMVLDPFLGSGTTAVACRQAGFRCVGIEREERYCEIAAKRLEQEVLDFGEITAKEGAG